MPSKRGLMSKQLWKHYTCACVPLEGVLNASSKRTQGSGNRMGRSWMGRFASAGMKSCAMFMALALGVVWSAAGQTPVKMAEEKTQSSPAAQMAQLNNERRPAAEELERWRKTLLKASRPKKACYTVTYPDTQWHEIACKTPPDKPYPPRHGIRPETVGNGPDFSAVVTGHITEAEGSFDSVTPSTLSECSVPCPINASGQIVCPVNPTCSLPGADDNAYSLQLNSKTFNTSACSGSPASTTPACQGWEQFVYEGAGSAFIQYWLENYGPAGTSCPASPAGLPPWHTFQFTSAGKCLLLDQRRERWPGDD